MKKEKNGEFDVPVGHTNGNSSIQKRKNQVNGCKAQLLFFILK
jgi:hypothetical protein